MVYYNILGIFTIRGLGGFIIRGRGLCLLGASRVDMSRVHRQLVRHIVVQFRSSIISTYEASRRVLGLRFWAGFMV